MRKNLTFLAFLLLINFSRAVDLNILLATIEDSLSPFQEYVDDFNEYSKENKLDINLTLKSMTTENFSLSIENSQMMFDNLVRRRKSQYDIYIYDAAWTPKYCSHFIDLSKELGESHIKNFNDSILSELNQCGDKIAGLPISVAYEALYSNTALLQKYNKEIPKTWQQLHDIGKEILDKERAEGNTELIGYNGVFGDAEMGICSAYGLLYSARKTHDSPLPELTSQECQDAAMLMRDIKDDLASDDIFSYSIVNTVTQYLPTGNAIFLKFFIHPIVYMIPNFQYTMSNLPGMKEGISGSILTGYNLGILNNLSKDKVKSALEVIKHMTTRETQKKFVLQRLATSPITSIYYEEDVCSSINNCEIYRDPQPILKPVTATDDFNQFSSRFTSYFYDFLYGDTDVYTALKSMTDLTKIYNVGASTKETSVGLVMIILFCVTAILMALSLVCLKSEKYSKVFTLIPKSSWCLIVFGAICILCAGFAKLGEVTSFKCQMNNILFFVGYSLIYSPLMCRLLMDFPEENKISRWVYNNQNMFVALLIGVNVLLNGLTLIGDYGIEDIIVNEGENFQKCKINTAYTLAMFIIIAAYNIFMLLTLFLVMFAEWNMKELAKEIRLVTSSIYMNVITFIVLSISSYLNIRNYKLYFILYVGLVYIIGMVNYLVLYGIRIIFPGFIIRENEEEDILKKIKVHESFYSKSGNGTVNVPSSVASTVSGATVTSQGTRTGHTSTGSFFQRVVSYHNQS